MIEILLGYLFAAARFYSGLLGYSSAGIWDRICAPELTSTWEIYWRTQALLGSPAATNNRDPYTSNGKELMIFKLLNRWSSNYD